MRSRTVHLPEGQPARDVLLAVARELERPPDFILSFLPPGGALRNTLAVLTSLWPDSLRFGCEAMTQFADASVTTAGAVHLFWLDHPRRNHVAVEVIPGTHGEPPSARRVEAVARRMAAADGVLLLVDGLRFPTEKFLAEIRKTLAGLPPMVAGGLASQGAPVTHAGARVFSGDRILPSACLAVTLHGVNMRVEVVRGWTPASPVYTITRAEGPVVWEIDGEPATDWYRRFFTIHGELAPLPDSSYRFPLLVEGPRPERQELYRSMRVFDDPPGAVTFWGDLETGDRVRLGMGDNVSLVRTASELVAGPPPDAAILYSCVGRESVLGGMSGQETAMIHKALGGAALSGFFTFGEIGPTPSGHLAYYNQTAILVLLQEVGA
jgi:hypothetical protein